MNPALQHADRLAGLDVVRALAIFGMAFIHVIASLSGVTITFSDYAPAFDWFSGRPAAMFMVLAGIGVSLIAKKTTTHNGNIHSATSLLARRGGFFFLFGFVNLLIWQGDILRVYGLAYLLASFVVLSSNTRLWLWTGFFPLAFLAMNLFLNFETNWDFESLEYFNLWTLDGAMMNLFFNGFRAIFPWLGLFTLGMLVGRQNLAENKVIVRLIVVGLLITVMSEILSSALLESMLPYATNSEETEAMLALFGTNSLPAMPLFMLSAGGTAVAIIMLFIWLGRRFPLNVIGNVGRQAFTWYILHIVIVLILTEVLSPNSDMDLETACFIWGGICIAITLASFFIAKGFKRGPLEWLLRKVTVPQNRESH